MSLAFTTPGPCAWRVRDFLGFFMTGRSLQICLISIVGKEIITYCNRFPFRTFSSAALTTHTSLHHKANSATTAKMQFSYITYSIGALALGQLSTAHPTNKTTIAATTNTTADIRKSLPVSNHPTLQRHPQSTSNSQKHPRQFRPSRLRCCNHPRPHKHNHLLPTRLHPHLRLHMQRPLPRRFTEKLHHGYLQEQH